MSDGATATRSPAPRPAARAGLAAARTALRRIPRGAWACMLVAILNGAAWALVTAPFQVVDEPSHYAYTEYLVGHGRPPKPQPGRYSLSESVAYGHLHVAQVAQSPGDPAIMMATEQRQLERDLARYRERDGNGASESADPEPPLYYVLAAVPFALGIPGDALDRLLLMRMLSVALSGVTVLLVYLFLREALPAHPWTWAVGALGVAFEPLFACMSGGANPDNLLYLVAAALFLAFARIFQRGFTQRRAVLVGVLLAIGFLTKINFVGLLPGAVVGLVVAAVRENGLRAEALRLPALALGVAAVPVGLEIAVNVLLWERPAFGSGVYTTSSFHPVLWDAIRYAWEFYLPALPGVPRITPGSFAPYDIWFRGYVGEFGWLDTVYQPWVYRAALAPFAVCVALLASAIVRERRALRARAAELLVYGALGAGMLVLIAAASYNLFAQGIGGAAEPRYLFPLLALYGAMVALAARGAGPRLIPVVGTALVMAALGHNLFGLLLEVARYHG